MTSFHPILPLQNWSVIHCRKRVFRQGIRLSVCNPIPVLSQKEASTVGNVKVVPIFGLEHK
jgi:hypothetical protein